MKVKITENVSIGGVIHKKDSTPDLKKEHAELLIDKKFAVEHKESKKAAGNEGGASGQGGEGAGNPSTLVPPAAELAERYGSMNKSQLGAVIADMKKVAEADPNYALAQATIDACKKLIKQ